MPQKPKRVTGNIKISVPEDVPAVYANHVAVNTSEDECILSFARVRIRPGDETDADGNIPARVDLQVIMPRRMLERLIGALQAHETPTEAPKEPARKSSAGAGE